MPPPGPMDSNGVQNMQNGASCRDDVEPAAPQGFSATPDGTGRIALSWGNGDASICIGELAAGQEFARQACAAAVS
jgi:hypothetical protein